MKVRIGDEILDGKPCEIMEQLRENSFDREQFPDLDGYIRYMCENYERMSGQPCTDHGSAINDRARKLLMKYADIDALEVLEDG